MKPILGYEQDGSPIINESSGYTEKGFSTEPEFRKTKWIEVQGDQGKEGQITMTGTYNMYCNMRTSIFIYPFYITVLGIDSENRVSSFYVWRI